MRLYSARPALPNVEIDTTAFERALWVVVVLSLVADVVTTMAGLRVGLVESNPIARSAIEDWGIAGMFALKALAVAIAMTCRPLLPSRYRPVVPAGLALPWVFASTFNVVVVAAVI